MQLVAALVCVVIVVYLASRLRSDEEEEPLSDRWRADINGLPNRGSWARVLPGRVSWISRQR